MSETPPTTEKLRLKVVEGNGAGMLIEVEDELVVGRQADGDGSLASDIEISRRHARIFAISEGHYGIEDLGSTNGTYINGRRIEGQTTLEAGDRITMGASALVVQVGRLQPTPTASDTIVPPGEAGSAAAPEPAAPESPAAAPPLAAPPLATGDTPPAGDAPPTAEVPAADTGPSQPDDASFALRIEVDLAARRARVLLDDTSDEVTLVHEDGRWRIR